MNFMILHKIKKVITYISEDNLTLVKETSQNETLKLLMYYLNKIYILGKIYLYQINTIKNIFMVIEVQF